MSLFLYQKTGRYFAQIPREFETLAEKELESLGAVQLKHGYRGIHFSKVLMQSKSQRYIWHGVNEVIGKFRGEKVDPAILQKLEERAVALGLI